MQADVSLRGLSFNQTVITFSGYPLNDPQTGHHNVNFPFTELDISSFGILTPSSSIFANLPTIDLKSSEYFGSLLRLGGRGYVKANARYGYMKNILSLEGFRWDGYEFEYDGKVYSNKANSFAISFNRKEETFNVFGGYRYNSFGAKGFYLPPTYESNETTQVAFLGVNFHNLLGFVRWHQDQFNWGKGRNIHNTINAGLEYPFNVRNLFVNAGGRAEYIRSSIVYRTSGRRDTMRITGILSSHLLFMGYGWFVKPGIRFSYDNFTNKPYYEPYMFSSYRFLSLNIYYSRRLPDFAEMFYSDPINKGDTTIKPERVLGMDFGLDSRIFTMKFFDRIDWVWDGNYKWV